MKTRFTLVLGLLIVGLLLTFASGAKAAEGDQTYTGVLNEFVTDPISNTVTAWILDTSTFKVGPATVIPPFFALKDTVVTTYTVDTATGDFLSKEFKVLNSSVDSSYTYTGTLTTINNDLWTVGDHTFLVKDIPLPPYYNINDTVEVTFKIVNGENVATAVKVTETVVGTKVESNRCENRMKKQPAVYKLAKELKEDPEKLTTYFCSGFGIGEIKLAYKLADKGYTPAMLLAMRASGMSWGEIKQLVAKAPATNPAAGSGSTVTSPSSGSSVSTTSHGNSANNTKSNNRNGSGKNKPNHSKKP